MKEGYTPEDVKHELRTKLDGLQIIETKSLSNSIRDSLAGFVVLLYVLIALGIYAVLQIFVYRMCSKAMVR